MANFNYLAQDAQNKEVKGIIEANDLSEAQVKLRQQGLFIISVEAKRRLLQKPAGGRIKNKDLGMFSHQLAVMIASGIPLIRALKAFVEEATDTKLRAIIDKVRLDIENGASLSGALSKFPDSFPNFFVNLIKTGEVAGALPTVLNRLAEHVDKQEDLRRKVSSSFAYPVIVSFVALGVVTFVLIFIVPVFRTVYKSLKVDLPGPTVALIMMSNIVIKFWWLILLIVGAIYVAFLKFRKNEAIDLAWDKFKLMLPVFGELNRKVAVSRFMRTISTLTASGVTLGEALNIAREVVDNRVIKNIIESAQKEINQGKNLTDALRAKKVFPSIALQMISVGEESGNLILMLDKCAAFLDEDIDVLIKGLVVKIEPVLTIFLAVLVGFIAMAIYLPMFDVIRQVNR